jgi:hypothetical protein
MVSATSPVSVSVGSCRMVDCIRHNMSGDVVKSQRGHIGGNIDNAMIVDSDVINNVCLTAE